MQAAHIQTDPETDRLMRDLVDALIPPATISAPPALPRIIEACNTLGGNWALTCIWPNGRETVELVSDEAAAVLGYVPEADPDDAVVPAMGPDMPFPLDPVGGIRVVEGADGTIRIVEAATGADAPADMVLGQVRTVEATPGGYPRGFRMAGHHCDDRR